MRQTAEVLLLAFLITTLLLLMGDRTGDVIRSMLESPHG